MIVINRIAWTNVKYIEDVDIRLSLDKVNVIKGANGRGKTVVMSDLSILPSIHQFKNDRVGTKEVEFIVDGNPYVAVFTYVPKKKEKGHTVSVSLVDMNTGEELNSSGMPSHYKSFLERELGMDTYNSGICHLTHESLSFISKSPANRLEYMKRIKKLDKLNDYDKILSSKIDYYKKVLNSHEIELMKLGGEDSLIDRIKDLKTKKERLDIDMTVLRNQLKSMESLITKKENIMFKMQSLRKFVDLADAILYNRLKHPEITDTSRLGELSECFSDKISKTETIVANLNEAIVKTTIDKAKLEESLNIERLEKVRKEYNELKSKLDVIGDVDDTNVETPSLLRAKNLINEIQNVSQSDIYMSNDLEELNGLRDKLVYNINELHDELDNLSEMSSMLNFSLYPKLYEMAIRDVNKSALSEYIISANEARTKITSIDELLFKKEEASENLKLVNKCLEILNYIDTINKFIKREFKIDALSIHGKLAQIDKALTENNKKKEKELLEYSLESFKSIAFLTDEDGLNEAIADLERMAQIITDSKVYMETYTLELQELKSLKSKSETLFTEFPEVAEKNIDYLNDRRYMSSREIENSETLLASLGIVDEMRLKKDLDRMKGDYDSTISDITKSEMNLEALKKIESSVLDTNRLLNIANASREAIRKTIPEIKIKNFMTDVINDANEFLSTISDVAIVDHIIQDGEFKLLTNFHNEVSELSTSYRTSVATALSISLNNKLSKYRVAKFDEIDGFYDTHNRENFVDMISNAKKLGYVDQVIVITHNPYFDDIDCNTIYI